MTFFQIKALLAVLFVVAGLTAAVSMLTLMGRTERRLAVMTLMRTHRAAGYAFTILFLALAVLGVRYLAAAGDALPLRGVLHWVLASLLVFVLALKLAVVRFFKQFIKFVPVMGMTVIVLALLVAAVSLGFLLVTAGTARPEATVQVTPAVETPTEDAVAGEPAGEPATEQLDDQADDTADSSAEGGGEEVDPGETVPETPAEHVAELQDEPVGDAPVEEPGEAVAEDTTRVTEQQPVETAAAPPADEPASGDPAAGEEVFLGYCASCHNADSEAAKVGPGLAGLFGRDKLGARGRPVTHENVRAQIVDPAGTMPSFESYLSESEIDDLVAYLGTL